MAEVLTRRQQAERTKQLLFDKGREVLKGVNNPDDFIVEDITDACGVSKGTFYLYFKSKGAFFYNVKISEVREIRDHLLSLLTDDGVSARAAILNFVRTWMRYIERYDVNTGKYWLALVSDEKTRSSSAAQGMLVSDYIDAVERAVCKGVTAGEFVADTPTERIARSVMVILHGFDTLSVITQKDLDFDEWVDQAARMVDDGVLRRWLWHSCPRRGWPPSL